VHKQINIGVAVSLGEQGLIVPVIKGADGMSLLGLARAVSDLAERARKKQLKPDEVVGSTFTLTNHGVSGSLFATPIINQPNVGILGVGAIQKRVVVVGDAIAIPPDGLHWLDLRPSRARRRVGRLVRRQDQRDAGKLGLICGRLRDEWPDSDLCTRNRIRSSHSYLVS